MIVDWPKRRPGIVLAALALVLLGSLFPRGYMPINDDGRITVTLCSAYGAQEVTIDLGKDQRPSQHTGSANCQGIFAGFAVAPETVPLLPPQLHWSAPAPQRAPGTAVAHFFHFDPNAPPQAPPAATI